MSNEIMVIIKFRFEGLHRWLHCNIEKVSYLRYYHRHVFHVTCWKQVYNTNREIEIITLKKEVEAFAKDEYSRSDKSCEKIAQELLETFNFNTVEVLEDGENGAIVRQT